MTFELRSEGSDNDLCEGWAAKRLACPEAWDEGDHDKLEGRPEN